MNVPKSAHYKGVATRIVKILLEQKPMTQRVLSEASLSRPRRGKIWIASFTGPTGGQTFKSTGLVQREQALELARTWEKEARAQRAKLGRMIRKPFVRVARSEAGIGAGLTQREVAEILHMSERGVREVERRALRKLLNHPLLRQIWQLYLAGELEEQQWVLTAKEKEALIGATRNAQERRLLQRVLPIVTQSKRERSFSTV